MFQMLWFEIFEKFKQSCSQLWLQDKTIRSLVVVSSFPFSSSSSSPFSYSSSSPPLLLSFLFWGLELDLTAQYSKVQYRTLQTHEELLTFISTYDKSW